MELKQPTTYYPNFLNTSSAGGGFEPTTLDINTSSSSTGKGLSTNLQSKPRNKRRHTNYSEKHSFHQHSGTKKELKNFEVIKSPNQSRFNHTVESSSIDEYSTLSDRCVIKKMISLSQKQTLQLTYSAVEKQVSGVILDRNCTVLSIKNEDLPSELRKVNNSIVFERLLEDAYVRTTHYNNGDISLYLNQRGRGGMMINDDEDDKNAATVSTDMNLSSILGEIRISLTKSRYNSSNLVSRQELIEKALKKQIYQQLNKEEQLDVIEKAFKKEIYDTLSSFKKALVIERAVQIIDSIKLPSEKKYEKVTLFLGQSGSGKSTLINYLIGKKIEIQNWRLNVEASSTIVGHGFESCTFFPIPCEDEQHGLTYFDCPGFEDSKGILHKIINAKLIREVIDQANKINFVIVVTEVPFEDRTHVQELINSIESLKNYAQDFEKFKEGILLVITKGSEMYDESFIVSQIDELIETSLPTDYFKDLLIFIKNENKLKYSFKKPMEKVGFINFSKQKPIIESIQTLQSIDKSHLENIDFRISGEAENRIIEFTNQVNTRIGRLLQVLGLSIEIHYTKRLQAAEAAVFEDLGALRLNCEQFCNELEAFRIENITTFSDFCTYIDTLIKKYEINIDVENLLEYKSQETILGLFRKMHPKFQKNPSEVYQKNYWLSELVKICNPMQAMVSCLLVLEKSQVIKPGSPYLQEENIERAKELISIANKYFRHGQEEEKQCKPNEAQECYQKALEVYKDALKFTQEIDIYKEYALFLANIGKNKEACRAFYELAHLYALDNKDTEALKFYEQATEILSDSQEVLHALKDIYEKKSMYEKARNCLIKIARCREPESLEKVQNTIKNAQEALQLARELNTCQQTELIRRLEDLYEKEIGKESESYQEALKLINKNKSIVQEKHSLLNSLKKACESYEEAITYSQKHNILLPVDVLKKCAKLYKYLANSAKKESKLQENISEYTEKAKKYKEDFFIRILEENPNNIRFYQKYLYFLKNAGRSEEASNLKEKIIQLETKQDEERNLLNLLKQVVITIDLKKNLTGVSAENSKKLVKLIPNLHNYPPQLKEGACLGLKYLKSKEAFSSKNSYFINESGLVYTKGQQLGPYIFQQDKEKGVEPGFMATRAWLEADMQNMQKNKEHIYYRQVNAFIEKYAMDSNQNPILFQEINKMLVLHEKFDRLSKLDQTKIIDKLKEIPEVQSEFKKFLRENHKKFQRTYYVKLDYKIADQRLDAVDLVSIPSRGNNLTTMIHRYWTSKSRKEANFNAIRECMANDLMRALGVFTQKLRIIPSQYEDGFPKLLLSGTHIEGPNEEKFDDFNKKIFEGYLIRDEDMHKLNYDLNSKQIISKIPNSILKTDQTIEGLGAYKIIMLLLADRDAIGSRGDNKGYLVDPKNPSRKIFAGIDPGHSLETESNSYLETKLIEYENINSDFSFNQPFGWTVDWASGGYKNFTIFDDTPFLEKMDGLMYIKNLKDSQQDLLIFEEYISRFNGSIHEKLQFQQELQKIKKAYVKRRDYILDEVFGQRLPFMKSKEGKLALNILDCLEKHTSKTSEYSQNKSVQLIYPRITERTEWFIFQDDIKKTYSFKAFSSLTQEQLNIKLKPLLNEGLEIIQDSISNIELKCEPIALKKLNKAVDIWEQYRNYKGKKCLTLDGEKCTEQTFSKITDQIRFERLIVNSAKNISEESLKNLNKLTNLESLTLRKNNYLTDDVLQSIGHIQGLESLNLGYCSHLTDLSIQHLLKLQSLKKLILIDYISLSDEGFKKLVSFKNLRTLGLSNCKNLTSEALMQISELKDLRDLRLGAFHQFTKNNIRTFIDQLKIIPNLIFLNLSDCSNLGDHEKQLIQKGLPKTSIIF